MLNPTGAPGSGQQHRRGSQVEERRATDLYHRAEQLLTAAASSIQRQDGMDLRTFSDLAAEISDSVGRDDQLVVQALAGPSGSTLVTNLVNVSILARKVGAGLGYYGQELHRLTLAGLVHDIGLFAVPPSIVTKSGRLNREERTLIEQHPELGYQLLHKQGSEWDWLAQVVRQAHERWNGQGYPNRLKGRAISELAQIIGAVDVFDALVTPRPYRRRFFPHEAVRELLIAERTAFPREIVKALVEQLSAYPLGTLVRLTTGEIGTVVRINSRFPLRPVVEITGATGEASGQEIRELDLSRAPLVSIIETLEAPTIERVSFQAGLAAERRSTTGLSVSDQFSALLENLDALANAIQGVVETRVPVTSSAGPERQAHDAARSRPRSSAQDLADTTFEKEVIGLFALEAHEWLAQIHGALKRLGEGGNGSLRPKLYGIVLQGLTNLARSASTVHLSVIEDMASSLLPILHDAGKQDPANVANALGSLRAGLDRIAAAVRHAEEAAPSEAYESKHVEEAPSPVSVTDVPPIQETLPSPSVPPSSSGGSLLTALRELQQVRSRSVQPARDVLESIIQRAEQEPGVLTVTEIKRILNDLDRMDEHFLNEVARRVPLIGRVLDELHKSGSTDFVTLSQLDPVLTHVEALHDAAASVHAGMITMFLQGLRSFLMVAAYRKASTLPQRLATVESRIQALLPMAEQWVSIGRVERAAIAEILPAP